MRDLIGGLLGGIFGWLTLPACAYQVNVAEALNWHSSKVEIETYYRRVYQQANIVPQFVYYPAKRGLKWVNEGQLDAEAVRLALIGSQYPNLRQVPVPIATLRTGLFCLTPSGCEGYANSMIAYTKGYRAAPHFCQQQQWDCVEGNSPGELRRLLSAGRVDALLLPLHDVATVLCGLSASPLFYILKPQFDRAVYHYVHHKHHAIIPALVRGIRLSAQHNPFVNLQQRWQQQITSCQVTLSALQTP